MVRVASRTILSLFSPDEETFANSLLWKNLLLRTDLHDAAVGGRARGHLEALKLRFPDLLSEYEVQETPQTDYADRLFVGQAGVGPSTHELYAQIGRLQVELEARNGLKKNLYGQVAVALAIRDITAAAEHSRRKANVLMACMRRRST